MSITDLILPKWKHSNPNVRLKTIREMKLINEDVLKEMAISDSDSNVRLEAVKRIANHQTLHEIMENSNDDSINTLIQERLNSLYREMFLKSQNEPSELKREIISQFKDESMLAAIACELAAEIDSPELRCLIVDQINSPEYLCLIAQHSFGLKAGLKIVEKLSEPHDLEKIAATASNKKVKREAERKLNKIIADLNRPSPETQLRIDLENLCVELENIVKVEEPAKKQAVLEQAVFSWNKLDPDNTHALRPRFDAVRKTIEDHLHRLEIQQAWLSQLERLCRQIEDILLMLPLDAETRIDQTNSEWEAVLAERPEGIADVLVIEFEQRFDTCCEKFVQQRKLQLAKEEAQRKILEQIEECCCRVEAIAAQEWSDEIQAQWNDITHQWTALNNQAVITESLKERFDAAHQAFIEKCRRQEADKLRLIEADKEYLLDICQRVENLIKAEERSGLEQVVKALQQEWNGAGKLAPEFKMELFARFRKACNRFFEHQADYWETKDWEKWANLTLKEELCQEAERLQDIPDSGMIAKIVPELKNRWKEIGPVARDKSDAVWNRFRTACDQAYQACFERKQALYEEARILIETDPNNINWKETTEMIKYIQEEWNRIGFLPNTLELELRDKFHNLCNRFFDQQRSFYKLMDTERHENFERKKALLNEAEAVLNAEYWFKYAGKMKKLQQQWKETGPIPKTEGDELWKQFRQACNTFFDRLKKDKPENLKKKIALCEQAEQLAAEAETNENSEAVSKKMIDLQLEWKTIGPTPQGQSEEVWERFRAACDCFFSKRKDQLSLIEAENVKRESEKERLIEAAEALSGSIEWRSTSERLKQLQREWKKIGAIPRKKERELWERFNNACDTFFSNCKKFFEEEELYRNDNLQRKEKICLYLEVLAVVSLPDKNLSYSDKAPMADQLSIALELKDEILVSGDKKDLWDRTLRRVKELQAEWKKIGLVPKEHEDTIWKRYRSALNLFFDSRSTGKAYGN